MKKMPMAYLVAATVLATPVSAQSTCMTRELVISRLDAQYAEKLVGRGLRGEDSLMEMFVSADGSSWTLVQSFASGKSCIMAAGTDWLYNDLKAAFSVDG